MIEWKKRGSERTIEEVVLRNLKLKSVEDINDWFKKHYLNGYRVDMLPEAVDLARTFKNKPVTIVGDYDADGVTSTAILYSALKWDGFTNVKCVIPKRFSEGFGINMSIIDNINEGLLITCDNGIAQLEAIKAAKDKGLTVIVIDHHMAACDEDGNTTLPPADVIIDPNAIDGSADFNGYCGAGLCYKFACQMLHQKGLKQKLLVFAAIGTVADVMELREENYAIVRVGLKLLINREYLTSGTYALISALGLNKAVTAHDVGFKIGPIINAASRMKDDGAYDALNLLLFDGDFSTAIRMTEDLIDRNDKRKEQKKDGIAKARDYIDQNVLFGEVPMVVYVEGVNPGILGIIAGALCEEYKLPVIILTDSPKESVLVGSSRSCGNYNLKEALDKADSLLLKHGGHAAAAGLSLEKVNLERLHTFLVDNAEAFELEDSLNMYDLEIAAKDIPKALAELAKFEPFGEGNPNVVFYIKDFITTPFTGSYKKMLGENESIVKLPGISATVIGFDKATAMEGFDTPKKLDLIGTIEVNRFNGREETQIELADFMVKDIEFISTPLASSLKAMARA